MRVVSGLVLAPPVVLALYAGPPYSDVLVIAAGAVMAWEWARVVRGRGMDPAVIGAAAVVTAALIAAAAGAYGAGLAALGVGAAAAAVRVRDRRGAILASGVLYIGAACMAFSWLRHAPEVGLALIAWLVATVWATDIAAYIVGRGVGGARLAPSVSPGKTWSGLLGGVAAAAGVGAACAVLLPALTDATGRGMLFFAWAGGLLGLISQGGDLLESAFKRYFHVKDVSNLIPGHGGLLDRADGLLAASLALGLALPLMRGAAW